MPSEICARSTASHSRRSATTLASGDQIATISSLAYRSASTLGIVTDTQLTAKGQRPGSGKVGAMHFVGLDLAWGEKKQTGVAVVATDGRLLHVGAAQDNADIEAAIAPFTAGDCVVAIDAPLIVKTTTGFRPCETAFNSVFQKYDAGAYPANTGNPAFNPPRAETIAALLGLDTDPASTSNRRAIEVYPHPAAVVL